VSACQSPLLSGFSLYYLPTFVHLRYSLEGHRPNQTVLL